MVLDGAYKYDVEYTTHVDYLGCYITHIYRGW